MAFNADIPTSGTSLRASNPQILENQESLQEAISNEHTFEGTSAGTQTGDHTQGSARCFIQDTAPATRIDGDNFLSTDLGSLWIDTNSSPINQFNSLTATTPTWTPVSTEVIATLLAANRVFLDTLGVTGDFDVNTDKFNVAAATGNTDVAGTIAVAGAGEIVGITTLGDASTLKTDAAPTPGSAEIANAKYVDEATVNPGTVKAWVNFDGRGTNGTCTINASFNVSGVERTAQGKYEVSWDTDFSSAHYVPSGLARGSVDRLSVSIDVAIALTGSVGSFVISNISNDQQIDPVTAMISALGSQ